MALDLDAIRREVADRHNLLLDKDDPVLATATLCDAALRGFLGQLEEAAARMEERASIGLVQELDAVKRSAEGLVGGASQYAAGAVREAGERAASLVLKAVDAKLKEVASLSEAMAKAREGSRVALFAAAASLVAAALAIGVAIGALLK